MAMNIHNTECSSGLSVLSSPWPSIQKRSQKTKKDEDGEKHGVASRQKGIQ